MKTARPVHTAFTDHADTPATITASRALRGNAGGTALEHAPNAYLDAATADANYLQRDGGNTITGVITPDGDETRDFGTDALKFRTLITRRADIVGGPGGNPTRSAASSYGLIVGRMFGSGTNTLELGAPAYPPLGVIGNIYSYYANNNISMTNDGGGSFMIGSAFAFRSNDNAYIDIPATAFGCFAGGYAYPYFGSSGCTSTLRNSSSGAFLWGYPAPTGTGTSHEISIGGGSFGSFCAGRTSGAGTATITTTSGAEGSFTQGIITGGNATGTGLLRSRGPGCFSQGFVSHSTAAGTAEIAARGQGSFAQGKAEGTGRIRAGTNVNNHRGTFAQGRALDGNIDAQNHGAFAQGFASGVNIVASAQASFAHGFARTNAITASGIASFAVGDSQNGAITASATNAVQFGPGVNAAADSVKVGTAGIRFFGTAGAPGTPVNGDMWVNAGSVYIHSNGVSCKCTNAVM